ncbi:MAG: hypothetical protein R3A47_11105 [Polyangiales bacterium]
MKHTSFFVATLGCALFAFVAFANPAHACSCMQQSAEQSRDHADVVFEGIVTSISLDGTGPMAAFDVSFTVQRAWKGNVPANIDVRTASNSAACGIAFSKGESYVVFANERNGAFWASLCGGSARTADSAQTIAALGDATVVSAVSEEPVTITKSATNNKTPAHQSLYIADKNEHAAAKLGCGRCALGVDSNRTPFVAGMIFVGLFLMLRRRR